MNQLLMVLCALLVSISVIFIVIEVRANFDRSFLIFGIVNLLICSFCIVDIVIQPSKQILYWTLLQHLIASFFPPFLLWHVSLIQNNINRSLIKFSFLASLVFSVLFLSGAMLKSVSEEVLTTACYNFTFVPYIIATQIYLIKKLSWKLENVSAKQKKFTLFYLIGILLLSAGSIADLLSIITGYGLLHLFPSYSFLGALGFSIAVTIIFTEKLTSIIREREVTFKKLREAYKDLEEVQTLKELGQSTAIINHEIRNYAAAISGYSEMLGMLPSLDERSKKIVARISECITHLTNFSNDILEFSRSRILKDKIPLNLEELIRKCIDTHFENKRDIFEINVEKSEFDSVINGDNNKLEQVFINIFKNSIEAKAQKIKIDLTSRETLLFCTVDDDGVGCTKEQLGQIFKSFYTTKKNVGGTGLGMCVVRSIIEVHGGHVNAYSKNVVGKGEHGISLHISFPKYEIEQPEKHDIVLIKEGIKNLANVIKVFQNVLISPHVMQDVGELDQKPFEKPPVTIIAAPGQLSLLRTKYGFNIQTFAIVEGINNLPFVVHENRDEYPALFSEEYLLKKIVACCGITNR
jgi:signal transduction histidine kinase